MEVKTHIVSKDFDGFTLMKWFRKNKTGHTHSLIQKLIRKKAIKVNGKNCKGNSELKTGDEITIPAKSIKKPKNKDQEIKVPTKEQVQKLFTNRVIFEDDNLIAINKEQGVAVQGGTGIEISVDDIIKHISLQKGEFYHIVLGNIYHNYYKMFVKTCWYLVQRRKDYHKNPKYVNNVNQIYIYYYYYCYYYNYY